MKHLNKSSLVRRSLLAATLLAASVSTLSAHAQGSGKSVRLIVAFPPGGPVDFVARSISEALGKELGATVVVESKAGGNGIIAAEYVAKSPADGSVLWLSSAGAVAINPGLYKNLPYNPVTDLTSISVVVRNDELLVVNPKNPATGPADFVANAKKQRTTLASSGRGSVPHLAGELLADITKAQLVDVPYKGAAPAITDVMAGHVDGFFGDVPGLIGHVRAGRLKPIAMAAEKRHPLLPDVKTFKEVGIEGVDSDNWYALFGPKGMSAADTDRVNQALKRALDTPAVKERLLNSGTLPAPSTPAELQALLKKDIAKWTRVIREKNITAD